MAGQLQHAQRFLFRIGCNKVICLELALLLSCIVIVLHCKGRRTNATEFIVDFAIGYHHPFFYILRIHLTLHPPFLPTSLAVYLLAFFTFVLSAANNGNFSDFLHFSTQCHFRILEIRMVTICTSCFKSVTLHFIFMGFE